MRDDNPPVRDNHFFDYTFPNQDLWRRRRPARKEGQYETKSNTVFHVATVLMQGLRGYRGYRLFSSDAICGNDVRLLHG